VNAETDVSSLGWWRFKATQEGQKQERNLTDWPVGFGPTFERELLPVSEPTKPMSERVVRLPQP